MSMVHGGSGQLELEGVIGVRLDPVTQPETLRQVT